MQRIVRRNVIIGAGAMGSAAAYHLARQREPVLLLEQFALGHDRGSSHGAARITRHSYAEASYARLMPAAFQAWRELEADAGQPLYIRTGGISLCPSGVDYVSRVAANLADLGVPHRRMNGREWNRANPAFSVPPGYDAVFEPDAGMLAAAKAVALQIDLAQTHGGDHTEVMAATPVRRIELDGPRPVIVTDMMEIVAERLIVTAGAWVKKLLPSLALPLQVTRQQVLYLRPADETPFRVGQFPVFIFMGNEPANAFYGMPGFQGLGVKVARHCGPEIDPDDDGDRIVGEPYREVVRGFLRDHIPALATAPIDLTEICLYTVAPDEHFLVDYFPGRADVIVASPCSGHGFKFSCLIGKLLSELATTGASQHWIASWKLTASAHPVA